MGLIGFMGPMGLMSCSSESSDGQESQQQYAVGFSASFAENAEGAAARMTRSEPQPGDGELTTELLRETGFGVYCWYTGSSPYTPGTAIKNVTSTILMLNQHVEYKNSQWTYSPSKYWPINKEEMLTLRAYAPYVSYTLQTDANGLPLLPVVVKADDYHNGTQHDPLWGTSKHGGSDDEGTTYGLLYNNLKLEQSGSETTKDNRDGTIDWYFHHGMSKLMFACSIIKDPGCDSVKIKKIVITPLYDKGLLSLSSEKSPESGLNKPQWTDCSSNDPEGMTVTLTDFASDPLVILTKKDEATEFVPLLSKGLLVIPRDYTSDPMNVTIFYSVDNDDTPLEASGTIKKDIEGNTSYTLNLSLTPSTKGMEITLVQSAFKNWEDGGTIDRTVYNW